MRASRLAGLLLGVVLLTLADALPVRAGWGGHEWTAGAPDYSPLHYWAPGLYRWRNYLFPRSVEDYPGYHAPAAPVHHWHWRR